MKRPFLYFIFIILIASALLVANDVIAGDTDNAEKINDELNRLRQELQSKRDNLLSLTNNEKSVLTNIRNIEENIDLTQSFISKLNSTSRKLLKQIRRLDERIDSTSNELDNSRSIFYSHLKAMYKRERGVPRWSFLLADSLSEAIRVFNLSRSAIEYDNNLVETIRLLKAEIEKNKAELVANRNQLEKIRNVRKKENYTLTREKKNRQNLLSQVRNQKKLQADAIAQLESEAAQLEKVLENLRTSRESEGEQIPDNMTAFYRFRKQLPWPVQGKVVLGYGDVKHPVYNTKTFNPGINIAAPYGTDVKACADGTAAYIGYLRGYGNFIIIEHGEGYYSLYARLSAVTVEEGGAVLKGDIIGKVGDAGEGTEPSLHFELRREKKSYNPLHWLK